MFKLRMVAKHSKTFMSLPAEDDVNFLPVLFI
jgi:hypothetical protein